MTRRMIDSSVWGNENFSELPMGARLLQLGIISHADDQGRMKANPAYLRAQVFPYDDIPAGDIQGWLEQMQANGTIILYEIGGKQFLQLTNWWKYQSLQYAQPSIYPRPHGWQDRIRKTLTKGYIVTCNWFKVNGDPIPDTCDMDGNPIGGNDGGTSTGNQPPTTPTKPPVTPVSTNGFEQYSSEHSGESAGEHSGEDTIKLNITKLNEKVVVVEANGSPEHRRTTTTTTEPLTAKFVREYERVWGLTLTSYHAEQLNEWVGRVTFEGWSYALQECAKTRNIGQWKYFEKILARIEKEGMAGSVPIEAKAVTGVVNINLAAV